MSSQHTVTPYSTCLLTSPLFPSELVLEIIQRLPFDDGKNIADLSRTHPRLRSLLKTYERSITKNLVRNELPHAQNDFPCDEETLGYAWLTHCIARYDIIDDVMAMLTSNINFYAVGKQNMALINTGLLLLYRLAAIESHTTKLTWLKSLPKDPLTAMYLAVNYATLTARYHGEGIIHQRTYGRFMDANMLSLRADIEFCFAEASLELGPHFIYSMLLPSVTDNEGETILLNFYHDHALHDWDVDNVVPGDFRPPITQGPQREPGSRPRSLWTTLLERLAELSECPLEEVRSLIEEHTNVGDHSLAWLDLSGKERLVAGCDLEDVDE